MAWCSMMVHHIEARELLYIDHNLLLTRIERATRADAYVNSASTITMLEYEVRRIGITMRRNPRVALNGAVSYVGVEHNCLAPALILDKVAYSGQQC